MLDPPADKEITAGMRFASSSLLGGWRDDTEPIDPAFGRLGDNAELIAALDAIDEKNIVDPEIPSFKEKPLSKYELMAMRYEDDDLLAEMEGWMDAALEKGSSIEPIDEFPDEFLFSVEPERADDDDGDAPVFDPALCDEAMLLADPPGAGGPS